MTEQSEAKRVVCCIGHFDFTLAFRGQRSLILVPLRLIPEALPETQTI